MRGLAGRGAAARVSLAVVALAAVGSVVTAIAARGRAWAVEVPAVAALALTWGTGVMVAFAAALHAVRRDREEGVLALVRARGIGAAAYAAARTGGLVAVLAIALGGATLAVGIAATATARPALPTAIASLSALVYALAFSATMGPVTMAVLGARTRSGGYAALLAVLVIPELLAPWTRGLVPAGWRAVVSIPAALDAVRHGVATPASGLGAALRAAAVLGVAVVAASLVAVLARIPEAADGADGADPERRAA